MEPMLERMRRECASPTGLGDYPVFRDYTMSCGWPTRRLEYSYALEYCLPRLVPGARVLDAGCGVTPFAALLSTLGACVDAVDVRPGDIDRMAAHANRVLGGDVRYRAADLADLHLLDPDGPFDVVTCISTLEHTTPGIDVLALSEMLRLLKPDGLLVVTVDVCPRDLASRWGQEGDRRRHAVPYTDVTFTHLLGRLLGREDPVLEEARALLAEIAPGDPRAFWTSHLASECGFGGDRGYLPLGFVLSRRAALPLPGEAERCGLAIEAVGELLHALASAESERDARLTVVRAQVARIDALDQACAERLDLARRLEQDVAKAREAIAAWQAVAEYERAIAPEREARHQSELEKLQARAAEEAAALVRIAEERGQVIDGLLAEVRRAQEAENIARAEGERIAAERLEVIRRLESAARTSQTHIAWRVTELEHVAAQREDAIRRLDSSLTEQTATMGRRVSELESVAAERLEVIQRLDQALQAAGAAMEARTAELEQVAAERLGVIQRLEAALRASDEGRTARLTELERVAAERLDLVQRLDRTLRELAAGPEGRIAELERTAAERLGVIQRLEAELRASDDGRTARLTELERAAAERLGVIQRLEAELRASDDGRTARLTELERVAAERLDLVQRLDRTLREVAAGPEGRIAELERTAAERLDLIRDLEAKLRERTAALQARVDALEGVAAERLALIDALSVEAERRCVQVLDLQAAQAELERVAAERLDVIRALETKLRERTAALQARVDALEGVAAERLALIDALSVEAERRRVVIHDLQAAQPGDGAPPRA
ncbi:MAG: methyltransferase domain-containing protein [Planctomycetes bacterium]|nr:methyltransferase domain-containing protein [Planctomycetota bacterium]